MLAAVRQYGEYDGHRQNYIVGWRPPLQQATGGRASLTRIQGWKRAHYNALNIELLVKGSI